MKKISGIDAKHFLLSVELLRDQVPDFHQYPYHLPALRNLDELHFHESVTFFVGENGSGKSTILEGIAVKYGFNPEGGSKNFNFATKETHSPLYQQLKVIKSFCRPQSGFFLRAESFYNVATEVERLNEISPNPEFLKLYGGNPPHQQSHGESFLNLFLNRFTEKGIYILDEPEAALSPRRLLVLIARMHQLVEQGSQFIIATHSPMLMAYDRAVIYHIDEDRISEKPFEETEHYRISKAFLNNHGKYIAELKGQLPGFTDTGSFR